MEQHCECIYNAGGSSPITGCFDDLTSKPIARPKVETLRMAASPCDGWCACLLARSERPHRGIEPARLMRMSWSCRKLSHSVGFPALFVWRSHPTIIQKFQAPKCRSLTKLFLRVGFPLHKPYPCTYIGEDLPSRYRKFLVKFTLKIFAVEKGTKYYLLSYQGNMINHYNDPYEPISIRILMNFMNQSGEGKILDKLVGDITPVTHL